MKSSRLAGEKLMVVAFFVCWGFVGLTVGASTADEQNAALFYYQAFLLCPEERTIPNELLRAVFTEKRIDESLNHSTSLEQMRKYARDGSSVIELVETGARIKSCNWGIIEPQAVEARWKRTGWLQSVTFIFGSDVIAKAFDGQYGSALAECMTLRRLAGHLADDLGVSPVEPVRVEARALGFMGHVLDVMPPDRERLMELKSQLQAAPRFWEVLPERIRRHFEQAIEAVRTDGRTLPSLRTRKAIISEIAQV